MKYSASIAANRFGMGARPGDLEKIGDNAKGWLDKQLSTTPQMPRPLKALQGSPTIAKEFLKLREERKQAKRANDDSRVKKTQRTIRQNFFKEVYARTLSGLNTDYPLQERLARFWADHFTVSSTKNTVRPLVGAFEREAIRPYILGKFEDMLIKVTSHPAMLLYLDNFQSVGPNSIGGQRRKKGLNENLAREILELHTLGVDGGYGQADVIAFAKVLTGWTLSLPRHKKGNVGEFLFMKRLHEPGTHQILGKKYPDRGAKQGIAVLKDLARHPATARFIATKLARHFISDNPPEKIITLLAQEFLETDGHLGKVMKKLVSLEDVWQPQPGNIKTSEEFVISALRGLNVTEFTPREIIESMYEMGQRPFEAPSPAGWPYEDAHWAGPDMILKRIEWAQAVAERSQITMPPQNLAQNILGQGLSAHTFLSIQRADSARQAVTLLLASPEFQRR